MARCLLKEGSPMMLSEGEGTDQEKAALENGYIAANIDLTRGDVNEQINSSLEYGTKEMTAKTKRKRRKKASESENQNESENQSENQSEQDGE